MENPAQIIVPATGTNGAQFKSSLPKPTGYRMLVKLPPKNEKVGLIHKPQDVTSFDQQFTLAVQVMAMGDDCYADKTRFPNGPLCKVGDWIQTKGSLEGSNSFKVAGYDEPFRYIDDDQVAALLESPDQVTRL